MRVPRPLKQYGIAKISCAIFMATGCGGSTGKTPPVIQQKLPEKPHVEPIANFLPAGFETITTTREEKVSAVSSEPLTWKIRRDDKGRLVSLASPGNIVTRYSFSSSPPESMDMNESADHRVLTRDDEGRLLQAEGGDCDISFRYYTFGLPAEIHSDGAPTIYYKYDVQDRPEEMRIGTTTIKYRYDAFGRITAVDTPAGAITYRYSLRARMIERRLPNGVRTIRSYNDNGLLSALAHVTKDDRIITSYEYTYRPDNLIASIDEKSRQYGHRTYQYKYDLMQRLAAVECTGQCTSYRYVYDELGNLKEVQEGAAEPLRFTNSPTGALVTGSRGDTQTDERGFIRTLGPTGDAVDYEFNLSGGISSALGGRLQYTYNALGLLTSRVDEGKKTEYLPNPLTDAWQPLWRREPDNRETVFIWDGDALLLEMRDNEVRYNLEDHLNSTRVQLNENGEGIAWNDYSPFGLPDGPTADGRLHEGFAGQFWDPKAHVYLVKARAYDPVTARFLQPDPQIRLPGTSKHSHSLYAYCGGDPVNFEDINGRESKSTTSTDYEDKMWKLREDYFDTQIQLSAPPATALEQKMQEALDREARRRELLRETGQTEPLPPSEPSIWETGEYRKDPYYQELDEQTKLPEVESLYTVNEYIRDEAESLAEAVKDRIVGGVIKDLKETSPLLKKIIAGRENLKKVGGILDDLSDLKNGRLASLIKSKLPGYHHYERTVKVLTHEFARRTVYKSNTEFDTALEDLFQRNKKGGSGRGPGGGGFGDGGGGFSDGGAGFGGGFGGSPFSAVPMTSPVGGVYLGGAGIILEDLGDLRGVAIDEDTGNLVLVGSGDRPVNLPPLRMDDVVTIFRAVYEHGEAPSVTIDPDEKNSHGPTMYVKHGPGTAGTYVGWILFECDRVMKTYQMGRDNNPPKSDISSKVPGYKEVLNSVYFGDGKNQVTAESGWVRFWIVPALQRRFDADSERLALFEVPLKVNTQKMKWENGALVGDHASAPSAGAKAFTKWFSRNYDLIANEVRMMPPADSGMNDPIPIFHELKRIALVTAIAERLRDQGEPMPSWMYNYEVEPFPVPANTPSLTEQKDNGPSGLTSRIYGGVSLAPPDKGMYVFDRNAFTSTTEKRNERRKERKQEKVNTVTVPKKIGQDNEVFVHRAGQEAELLTREIPKIAKIGTVNRKSGISRSSVDHGSVSAAVLPGARTRDLAPNRQSVDDIRIPLGLGHSISLTRYYNSFFAPTGEYGKGWTLDLPELRIIKIPTNRDDEKIEHRTVLNLVTPLGDMNVLFDRIEKIKSYGVEMFVGDKHPGIVGVSHGKSIQLQEPTFQVFFNNGQVWHFGENHHRLLLTENEGFSTAYYRNTKGLVKNIVGYVGRDEAARIRLSYDQSGRIASAVATQADYLKKQYPVSQAQLSFAYSPEGCLSTVRTNGTTEASVIWQYTYDKETRLKSVSERDQTVVYKYNEKAQLTSINEGARMTRYDVKRKDDSVKFSRSIKSNQSTIEEVSTYDNQMRLKSTRLSDGRSVDREYGDGQEMTETFYFNSEPIVSKHVSADAKTETIETPSGLSLALIKNDLNQVSRMVRNGRVIVDVTWQPGGFIGVMKMGNTEIQPTHNNGGWQDGVVVSAPVKEDGKTNEWLEKKWDQMGRPVKITDSSGLDVYFDYDELGRLSRLGRQNIDGNDLKTNFIYNEAGHLTSVESASEIRKLSYADTGELASIETSRKGATSRTNYDPLGRPTSTLQYDGSQTQWLYDEDESAPSLKAIILPTGQRISINKGKSDHGIDETIEFHNARVRLLNDFESGESVITWGAM